MTNNNHPITPPPELVREWTINDDFPFSTGTFDLVSITKDRLRSIATQAARWGADQQLRLDAEQINQAWQKGADQELEACHAWVEDNFGPEFAEHLRLFRRPKPPSLKEQALAKLEAMERLWEASGNTPSDLVRRALEFLPD